jgi:polar amino acid transport system substrate-binding protein
VGTAKPNKSALLNDNVLITMTFANGSVANICYVADGSKAMSKEFVEVFGGGKSAVIHDFKEVRLYEGDTKEKVVKKSAQDKGQKAMLSAWVEGLKTGQACVDYTTLMQASLATILAVESMTVGVPLAIDLAVLNGE